MKKTKTKQKLSNVKNIFGDIIILEKKSFYDFYSGEKKRKIPINSEKTIFSLHKFKAIDFQKNKRQLYRIKIMSKKYIFSAQLH